jgi:pyruvate dehydrogenase E2 component (dihydrolipoamide acetyltransferase)
MANIITMPKLGFDMSEGALANWVVAEGDSVQKGEVLAEIETDKATVEVESSFSGVVRQHLVKAGEVLPVGKPIAVIAEKTEIYNLESLIDKQSEGNQSSVTENNVDRIEHDSEPVGQGKIGKKKSMGFERVIASPLARKLAQENNVVLSSIMGSGSGGRIVKRDVISAIDQDVTEVVELTGAVFTASNNGGISQNKNKIDRLRSTIGRRMQKAKVEIPHFYLTRDYDLDALIELRKQINQEFQDKKIKISINDFVVKATALALEKYPNLNASINEEHIIHHSHINIGIAVSVNNGLLTVVSKDANQKTLRQISLDTREMVTRVRNGKVRPGDIEGSTFSVSNLGMYDIEHFVAIINPPEAAILAVGAASQLPIYKDNKVQVGWKMKVTLSVDHRISDGAEGAQFLAELAKYLQQPFLMLI